MLKNITSKNRLIKKIFVALTCATVTGFLTIYLACMYYESSLENQVSQDSSVKVSASTQIKQKIIYSKCGDEVIINLKANENLIGLNMVQFKRAYPGWLINHFDGQKIEMVYQVDGLCPEHANNQYLGLKDGFVAIFYGVPGKKAILKEITKIPIANLQGADRKELIQGLVVHNQEELMGILEGMQAR